MATRRAIAFNLLHHPDGLEGRFAFLPPLALIAQRHSRLFRLLLLHVSREIFNWQMRYEVE